MVGIDPEVRLGWFTGLSRRETLGSQSSLSFERNIEILYGLWRVLFREMTESERRGLRGLEVGAGSEVMMN